MVAERQYETAEQFYLRALEAIAGCYDDALDYLAEYPDEDIPF